MPDAIGFATIAAKFILYLGVFGASGTVFAALLFKLTLIRNLATGFAALGLAGATFLFSIKGAMLTGDASGMIDLDMLALLWSTPVGTALALRIIGLLIIVGALFVPRGSHIIATIGGILAIWSFDHVGHISNRDIRWLDAALTLHLITVAFWIGILPPLQRLARNPKTIQAAATLGHRFGQIAAVAVPMLIFAGLYMSYEMTGSIAALTQTGYGQALLIKVGIVAGLLSLAALNKLRFIPRMQQGDAAAAAHLSHAITLEWAAIIAILGTTATLTSVLNLPV